jgi:hypothetical protein
MSSVARLVGLACGSVLVLALTARAAGPADPLFQLVPPDAAATLAIEDLRGNLRELLESPAAEGFRRLPAFRDWLASERFRKFEEAMKRIEEAVGEKVSTIRDELLGDAVVLTLRIPPDGKPDEARGLLLMRVRDRALLERLIRGVNAAQARSGELSRFVRLNREGVAYWSREFRPATRRPNEYLTVLDDNTFAWSNAEDLIQGVIDRKAGKARSLGGEPKFREIRRRLPEPSALSLFVDPGFVARQLASPARPRRPAEDRAAAMLGRYVGAMEYFGAALRWRDGVVLQTEEIIDPGKLDPWLRRWAARPGEIGPGLRRVPSTALAMASLHVDFNALLDALRDLVPDAQQPRLENLVLALEGVLLGHDLQAEILPQLGPGVLAYVEAPSAEDDTPASRLSKVLVIGLGNASGLTAAIENALRTFLAFYSLDPKHGDGQLRVESRDVEGRKVTTLRPTSPFAFAIDGDRLILGSSAAAVARSLTRLAPAPATATASVLGQLRADRFPEVGSFACVDFPQLHQFLLTHRVPLVERLAARQRRPIAEVGGDLDQALALMALFQQAYITSTIEPDASAIHRTVGLIARKSAQAAAP